jgi:hypothetical protein
LLVRPARGSFDFDLHRTADFRYDFGRRRFSGDLNKVVNRGVHSVWLIIPLIYFLGWWQTGSLRQAFNGTIAWILAFSAVALALLFLDVGGFSGLSATPESPAAAIAILAGFVGMWISNYLWRRRGGDPIRKPGKWERSMRAMLGMDKKKKGTKKRAPAMQAPAPQQQVPPPPPPQPVQSAPAPVDAQYRPAQQPGISHAPQQTFQSAPAGQQPAPQPQPGAPPGTVQQYPAPVQSQPPPPPRKKKRRNSPTADKYAKATGRALGAMFRGGDKKKKTKSPPGQS